MKDVLGQDLYIGAPVVYRSKRSLRKGIVKSMNEKEQEVRIYTKQCCANYWNDNPAYFRRCGQTLSSKSVALVQASLLEDVDVQVLIEGKRVEISAADKRKVWLEN